jgi:hypothetical protein
MREFLITNIVTLQDEVFNGENTDQEKIEKLVRLTTLQECLTEYLLGEIDGLTPLWTVTQS